MFDKKSSLICATLTTFFRVTVFLLLFDVIFKYESFKTNLFMELLEIFFASLIVTVLIWCSSIVRQKFRS